MKRPLSIVITVKNEEEHIGELLDSLCLQEGPFEVVIVDAESTDNTIKIIESYKEKLNIKLIVKKSTRGGGRNIGVKNSSYDYVVFTDGDIIVSKNWLEEMRKFIDMGNDVVAGKTLYVGNEKFSLERVELIYMGYDVTFPSCNLAYRKELFLKIGGFDESLITAEDIDLNMRAIMAGAKFAYNENAIVYHKTRDDLISFLKQAFWNGYGRAQLSSKHGKLWKQHSIKNALIGQRISFYGIARLTFALIGYLNAKVVK
ncbi:MAG: glycosyltransferase [Thermoplasmata archaeon]